MEEFVISNPLEGVYHIADALGVHFTFLVGKKRALLYDAGYGLFDPRPMLARITPLEYTVIMSHAHFDHAIGARFFPKVYMHSADFPILPEYAGRYQRGRTLSIAGMRGIRIDNEDEYRKTDFSMFTRLSASSFDLGGLTANVVEMPGHTLGSVGLYVPELELLLTADSFNPTTWLFFHEAVPLGDYVAMMQRVIKLPFTRALSPHKPDITSRELVEEFVDGLNKATFAKAERVRIEPYTNINTYRCNPSESFSLTFDADKAR
ncbi:MAG: MBL fold metallo-hydrolase [Eubacteriales bacterium]|nr:MBL fold metallo-hydrolase [Eubacteriales bacterium]MDD3881017.1 MBL fold metallo-hydrolase [Eubacteriales bacterium]MDD4511914.1 MBL fold metallo-hydrolase [Eubacteriales bacterium]